MEKNEISTISSDMKPDAPIGFGYKTNWFAIHTDDVQAVIKAMQLSGVKTSNWQAGLKLSQLWQRAPASKPVFVSPSVKGWVLVTSTWLPIPQEDGPGESGDMREKFDKLFAHLAGRFDEVQFFGTHSVGGYFAWGRARHGQVVRLFSIVEGNVAANFGAQTAEEAHLKLLDLGQRTTDEAKAYLREYDKHIDQLVSQATEGGKTWGDAMRDVKRHQQFHPAEEEDTMEMARAWSINPNELGQLPLPSGIGHIGDLPPEFAN